MKKIIISLLVVLCVYVAKAQEYIPIPMDSAIWSVNSAKYFVHGDTIINGKTYSKVYWQSDTVEFDFDMNKASYYAAIRNDTANKKVYGVYHKADSVFKHDYYWSESPATYLFYNCDTCELLLYDFDSSSWENDLIVYAFPLYFYYKNGDFLIKTSNIMQLKLNQISEVNVNVYGITRRMIFVKYIDMQNPSNCFSSVWYEGIGSRGGIFTTNDFGAIQQELLCFEERNSLLYKLDTVCFRHFDKGIGSVQESDFGEKLYLFPNPGNDFITIINTENVAFLIISDMLGRQVKSFAYSSKSESITMNISNLSKGIYFLSLYNKDFSSKKVLKLIIE